MTVRAIETLYAGCRFRSRTEARWAVFFDALGVKWEFEKEGFELPSGRYLPDFWLPEFDAWLEVKGAAATEAETKLAEELYRGTGQIVAIVTGQPCEVVLPALDRLRYQICWPARLVDAINATVAAKSARFEFSETGVRQRRLATRKDPLRRRSLSPTGSGQDWSIMEMSPSGDSGGIAAYDLTRADAFRVALIVAMASDDELHSPLSSEIKTSLPAEAF